MPYTDYSEIDRLHSEWSRIDNAAIGWLTREYLFLKLVGKLTFTIAARIIVLSVRSSGAIRELEAFDQTPYGLIDYNEE